MAEQVMRKRTGGFYNRIEQIGNKIPNPMVFFVWFAGIVIVASWVLSLVGFQAVNPATGELVTVYNLLSREGIVKILTSMVSNFTGLAVLGPVLTCMLGVGVCEKAGLFRVVLQKTVESSKGSDTKVIFIFAFIAVMADAAGGTGFVIMPVLGAALFGTMGRNPVAGALFGYGTVSGAFASNLLLTSMDVTNYAFTVAAAQVFDPTFTASPAMNYFFSAFSVLTLTLASSFVTLKTVEPRLEKNGNVEKLERQIAELSPQENKGLHAAIIAVLAYIAVLLALSIPSNGLLRDVQSGSLIASSSPLMKGLPFFIALLFFIPGIAYGFKSGSFKSSNDVVDALGNAMVDMGPFVALCFVIAQFLKYFDWSNIAVILAIKGAILLENSGLPIIVILVLFVILCGCLNMFIGSASAKWGLMASVFVPMFMILGYHPALIQMCYRIGDAVTNPITPAFAYFAMLLALCKKYDNSVGFGTLMANMLPYSIAFFVVFIIQLIIWFVFQIPFGFGAGVTL